MIRTHITATLLDGTFVTEARASVPTFELGQVDLECAYAEYQANGDVAYMTIRLEDNVTGSTLLAYSYEDESVKIARATMTLTRVYVIRFANGKTKYIDLLKMAREEVDNLSLEEVYSELANHHYQWDQESAKWVWNPVK